MPKILGIESSCDETAAAVVVSEDDKTEVKSNIISSQIDLHKKYGGVVPELASRKHIEVITEIADSAINESCMSFTDIDGIAVTYAPGLVGALLVGVNYAKSLAFALKKPLIPVHHIEGHISALYIENFDIKPPFVCLVASGGHSTIVHVKDYLTFETIAKTRDDAAGEAFDKVARVLGLGYPGGPVIQEHARLGRDDAIAFPRVKMGESLDFSFSGIKTSVINYIHNANQKNEHINTNDLAASFQKAVCDVLSDRLIEATRILDVNTVAIAGGVASNTMLRDLIAKKASNNCYKYYYPSLKYCTDNAAMIAMRGVHLYKTGTFDVDTSLNAYAVRSFGTIG